MRVELPENSDRPSFRADTIEMAVLGKLRQFMSNERTKRAIRSEIDRRTKKDVERSFEAVIVADSVMLHNGRRLTQGEPAAFHLCSNSNTYCRRADL